VDHGSAECETPGKCARAVQYVQRFGLGCRRREDGGYLVWPVAEQQNTEPRRVDIFLPHQKAHVITRVNVQCYGTSMGSYVCTVCYKYTLFDTATQQAHICPRGDGFSGLCPSMPGLSATVIIFGRMNALGVLLLKEDDRM
jgi:hypothetical protein